MTQFYCHFIKSTRVIVGIKPHNRSTNDVACIEIEDEVAEKILSMKENTNQYKITLEDEHFVFLKKTDIARRKLFLNRIQLTHLIEIRKSNIRTEDKKKTHITIKVNKRTKHVQFVFSYDIFEENNDYVEFYLTAKNDPSHLIATLKITRLDSKIHFAKSGKNDVVNVHGVFKNAENSVIFWNTVDDFNSEEWRRRSYEVDPHDPTLIKKIITPEIVDTKHINNVDFFLKYIPKHFSIYTQRTFSLFEKIKTCRLEVI